MFMLVFSLVWITVIGFAGAFAWIKYGLADPEDFPEIRRDGADRLALEHWLP
jgi:hypothetical protein